MRIELTLPFPPSINRAWRIGKGNWYNSLESKKYAEEILYCIHQSKCKKFDPSDRLKIEIYLYPKNKRSFDLDNRLKKLLDALQDAGVFENDSQIDQIWVERKEIIKNGKAHIVLTKIAEVHYNDPIYSGI